MNVNDREQMYLMANDCNWLHIRQFVNDYEWMWINVNDCEWLWMNVNDCEWM